MSFWPGSRPWAECRESGFPPEVPVWQSNWLLVIIDNVVHILTNGVVLFYLG